MAGRPAALPPWALPAPRVSRGHPRWSRGAAGGGGGWQRSALGSCRCARPAASPRRLHVGPWELPRGRRRVPFTDEGRSPLPGTPDGAGSRPQAEGTSFHIVAFKDLTEIRVTRWLSGGLGPQGGAVGFGPAWCAAPAERLRVRSGRRPWEMRRLCRDDVPSTETPSRRAGRKRRFSEQGTWDEGAAAGEQWPHALLVPAPAPRTRLRGRFV